MSEFSESYHLKSNDQGDGVNLLKRAGLSGYVLPEGNGWVTLVIEGSEFQPIEQLINANQGQLIHYIYTEDHGWAFSIYFNSERFCGYECAWEEEIFINDTDLDIDVISRLTNDKEVGSDDFKEIFYPKNFDNIFDNPPAYRLANIISLEHYQWISFDYINSSVENGDTGLQVDLNKIVHVN